jgi:pimeloyl-ACP methyl ester carboxylesterase
MLDERALISRLESADPDELARMLQRPSAEEERVLRAHLGDERYARMHALALRRSSSRSAQAPRGNVVVIHGIMGGELTAFDRRGRGDHIWAQALRLIAGGIRHLRLADDGRAAYDAAVDVRSTGIMKRHYGEQLLSLSQEWNVRAFWFDWRKDLRVAAAELEARINGWFDAEAPVHIVAHSMGGLVARTFIEAYPKRWQAMWDAASPDDAKQGGRLIMLGTPNHGSFAVPQIITGLEGMVRKLALVDLRHRTRDLLRIVNSFVGSYQMLPSPLVMPAMKELYRSETYGDLQVPQHHLDNARSHHERLAGVVDPERMVYVAGHDQTTLADIPDMAKIAQRAGYALTLEGDGRVPHRLGLLDGVRTFYVKEDHGALPQNRHVMSAMGELLRAGETRLLPDSPPPRRAAPPTQEQLRAQWVGSEEAELAEMEAQVRRLRVRSVLPTDAPPRVSHEERRVEDQLTRGFLSDATEREGAGARRVAEPLPPARIEIVVEVGSIEEAPQTPAGAPPIDAIAVGHYIGVRPQAAERAIDTAISAAMAGDPAEPEHGGVLADFSERGTLRGDLGQPFFLADPRPNDVPGGRVIAVAGMGVPGRFGTPELTVLARELCWALGRMGKQHLATVLIGSGNGNLPVREAVAAWVRGVKHAVTGTAEGERPRLDRITFVEHDPARALEIMDALEAEQRRLDGRLTIAFTPLDDVAREALTAAALQQAHERVSRRDERRRAPSEEREAAPTRVTITLGSGVYRFGAITADASIPERDVPLDPALVMRANDELAAEWTPDMQYERGRFMERLLVPEDLRAQLATGAPLVMLMDATTARIHWEMVAQPDPLGFRMDGAGARLGVDRLFLGTSRGFTRQLRTGFAPPPEPPPPPRRQLRVLVVADPAEDAHLPGAEEEGVEVAEMFEGFNAAWSELSENRVEVVRLFGPREATRTNVLRHLMLRSYDVLHFAGHCVFDVLDPEASGWIFTGGERLTARELNRIDRIPAFVFSNACESGITPDRSEERSADLAPSFAEAFFHRGVTNFVCTAWPVDDLAARDFARTLYGGLLGVEPQATVGERWTPVPPVSMHEAMRAARLAIAEYPGGARCWGAYQHYGNPYYRFFERASMLRDRSLTLSRESIGSLLQRGPAAAAPRAAKPRVSAKAAAKPARPAPAGGAAS